MKQAGRICAEALRSVLAEVEAGVRALLPILLGVVPFGLISGIAVVQTRIPPASGLVMSLLIFSGGLILHGSLFSAAETAFLDEL